MQNAAAGAPSKGFFFEDKKPARRDVRVERIQRAPAPRAPRATLRRALVAPPQPAEAHGAEIEALRKELAALRQEIRELRTMLRGANNRR